MYTIEDNIPIEPKSNWGNEVEDANAALSVMDVGQSVLVDGPSTCTAVQAFRVTSKKLGMKVKSKADYEKGSPQKTRVWRIE